MTEKHTVGAQVEGSRVPAKYADFLSSFNDTDPNIVGKIAQFLSKLETENLTRSETNDRGIFSSDLSNFEKRYVPDYEKLQIICESMRTLGHHIVLTSGSFDIIHIGHAQYLEKASQFGDFLIVGVDSDEKIKQKKGEHRPIVEESERLHMLAHLRSANLLTIKNSSDKKWQLIKTVRPDTLIATEGTYSKEDVKELEANFVGRVVTLPPQSTTSTTARLRKIGMGAMYDAEMALSKEISKIEGIDDTRKQSLIQIAVIALKSSYGIKSE